MKIKLFFLLQFSIILMSVIAEEKTVLSITEELAVKMALEENLSYKSAEIDLEGARTNASSNWNILLPDFNVSSGISRSESLLNDRGTSSGWGFTGSLSADLMLNGASALYGKTNNLAFEVQSISFEESRTSLILDVRKQFFYLIAYRENLDLQQRNIDLAEKRYNQAVINFENGRASELTVMEARNSYESLKPSLQDAETFYETQLMTFKKLIGLDLKQSIVVEGSLVFELLQADGDMLIDRYLLNRHDVRSALKAIEQAENQELITKTGNYSPILSLSSSWANVTQDIPDSDWNDSFTISAYLTLPLNGYIPGSSESLAYQDASRTVEKTRINLDEVLLSAEQDVRIILMELDGNRKNIEKNQLSLDLAQKTFDMTEAAYQQGTREVLDVEDAQNNLLSAAQNLLLSNYSYLSGLLDLEYALNVELEKIYSLGE